MKRGLLFVLALLTAGCGFSPLYGQVEGGGPAIGEVVIPEIEGRAGHMLKAELDRILAVERGSGHPLTLEVTLAETISGVGYRIDESASRSALTLIANYVLHFPNGEVSRGSVLSTVQFDVPDSAFGEIALQDDARDRAAETLARRMRAELAIRVAQERRE